MELLDKIIQEWSWRTKRGYPDISNEEDLKILKELFGIDLVNEADNSSFDAIIEETFKEGIPAVKGKYKLPEQTSEFKIDSADQEAFKALFYKAPDKSVGNGEVALYWLFNYANPSSPTDRARENRGADDPDLLVDGNGLEVKSYNSHDKKSTLGKFKSDVESRKLINALFGITNMSKVFGEEGSFNSEVVFNMAILRDAFQEVLKIQKVFAEDNVKEVLESYPVFAEMQKQVNTLLGMVDSKDPEELAKKVMVTLLKTKLEKKPGAGNYIINLKESNPFDIKIFRIPKDIEGGLMDKSFEHLAKNTAVNSAEIQFKYSIFD
jgi:hypothetical protein